MLAAAVNFATESECDALFVLGDLFDNTHPLPQLIAKTMLVLESPMAVYPMGGNHDQVSFAAEDTALAPLPLGPSNVYVIDQPEIVAVYGKSEKDTPINILCVPFHPGRTSDWLSSLVRRAKWDSAAEVPKGKRPVKPHRLLALHQGIRHSGTSKFLRNAEDAIDVPTLAKVLHENDVSYCFAGHWHEHYWNHPEHIMQVGALVPTGFDNPGLEAYGSVITWDNGGVVRDTLPGPRFIKHVGVKGVADASDHWGKDKVFLSIEVSGPRNAPAARDEVELLIEEGVIVDGEVTISHGEAQCQARKAANVAASASTLNEAVAEYVEEMPLPDEVNRGAVLSKVKAYLDGS